jgi:putative spermidine/putrescine transport system substrate-binding protein
MKKITRGFAVLAALTLLAAACGNNNGGGSSSGGGGGGGGTGPTLAKYDPNATGEGQLNLIAWPGYTQKSWVKPFESETGCQVTVKYGNTSDEMVNLMRQGGGTQYDGVSASGDATNRLIAAGDVAPIDVSSFPEYKNVMQSLQAPAHNTVGGVHYGVPYMWGPNFLMYNTNVVTPPPTSWASVFETTINGAPNPYAGKITAYDSPIYIADAALYLKSTQPSLQITDPYELTQAQLTAATDLLKQQAGMIKKYWAVYTDEIDGFESGDMVIGTAWPVNQSVIKADKKVPVASVYPKEGVTGWADTWMMSSHAQHPICMLKWMEYTLRPDVQTAVAEYYGATPSNSASCTKLNKDLGTDAANYHCGDNAFLSQVKLWKTPLSACGDSRGNTCMDYSAWTNAWTQIRGAG